VSLISVCGLPVRSASVRPTQWPYDHLKRFGVCSQPQHPTIWFIDAVENSVTGHHPTVGAGPVGGQLPAPCVLRPASGARWRGGQ
jgi:hypothetical protein